MKIQSEKIDIDINPLKSMTSKEFRKRKKLRAKQNEISKEEKA